MKLLPIIVAVLLAASAAAQAASAKHPELRSACKAGSVPAHIGGKSVCLHVGLKCRARYERAYERKGYKCVSGRLQKILPPPPPAPPPTALPGLYRFTTSQCAAATLCNQGTLTVLPGGLNFTNFIVPYSAECTPPHPFVSLLNTKQDFPLTIDPGLTFEISGTFPFTDGAGNAIGTGNATTKGQFDTAGNVSGTFDVHASVDAAGTHYECDTGQLIFSGKLSSH